MIRLLRRLTSGDLELTSFADENLPPFAILSHTWIGGQEVSYNELVAGASNDKAGYDKIHFCAAQAAADGLEYFWVDTCCINRSALFELITAINSMFKWYQRADKCYVYMTDVPWTDDGSWRGPFRRSRWFTRGLTFPFIRR